MTRTEWRLLTWVARNWPWGWEHLVTPGMRALWARIALAMSANSLHARQWGDSVLDIPPWVPCRPCGGGPCTWEDDQDIQADPYPDGMLNRLGRGTLPWDDGPGPWPD